MYIQRKIPIILFGEYVVCINLLEKFVSYYIINNINYLLNIELKQLVINYTKDCTKYKKNLIVFFLFAFFLEIVSYSKVIFTYVKQDIPDFNIISSQLAGFKVVLRNNMMYSFINHYFYNSLLNEKVFNGLIFIKDFSNQFGYLNFVIPNLYVFSEINYFFEQINEFFIGYNISMNINICLTTNSLFGILIYLSHIQVPINYLIYYEN